MKHLLKPVAQTDVACPHVQLYSPHQQNCLRAIYYSSSTHAWQLDYRRLTCAIDAGPLH